MTRRDRQLARLLRWYPPAWRARYGDELVAMMEDTLADGEPSVPFRLAIVFAGLRERTRPRALAAIDLPPLDRKREGALLVLAGWCGCVIGGLVFAKSTEHWSAAVPRGSAFGPHVAFAAVSVAAVLGAVAVLLGAVATVPSSIRSVRVGGWAPFARPAVRTAVIGLTAVVTTAVLVAWAHEIHGDGRSAPFGALFLLWAALIATTLVSATAAAIECARRLDLPTVVVHIEAAMALTAAAAVVVVAGSVVTWWALLAARAPWSLEGGVRSAGGSGWSWPIAGSVVLLVVSAAVAVTGAVRILRGPSDAPAPT
ncbi:MAG: hypothetical protein JWL73_3099 [Actinomycetia bacterium]|nr:hypothetical protein [Actinomycetes bacterium]